MTIQPLNSKYNIIDCHTHAWEPEDLTAIESLKQILDEGLSPDSPYNWSPRFTGTVDDLLLEEKIAGIQHCVLLPTSSKPERCMELTEWAAEMGRIHPEIIPFGSIHPHSQSLESDVERVVKLGLKAVKLHSLIQRFDPLSREAVTLYALLEAKGLRAVFDSMHLAGAAAVKPNLSSWTPTAQKLKLETGPIQIAEIARLFPGLKIIAAHLGCCYGWDHLEPVMDQDNVYFDISYVHRLISPERAVGIIRRKGAERIIFGTDAPYRRPVNALKWFLDLPLNEEEREGILSKNLLSLLGSE